MTRQTQEDANANVLQEYDQSKATMSQDLSSYWLDTYTDVDQQAAKAFIRFHI